MNKQLRKSPTDMPSNEPNKDNYVRVSPEIVLRCDKLTNHHNNLSWYYRDLIGRDRVHKKKIS